MNDADMSTGRIPNESVAQELKRILEDDDSRLGEVYRLSKAGKSAEAIRNELGVNTAGFVWSYLSITRALLEGEIASAPTVARQHAARFRSILKHGRISVEARELLEHNLSLLNSVVNDERATEKELTNVRQGSQDLEEMLNAEAVPGIYVYSFPNLLRHPLKEDTGRTLYKVGRSEDVKKRVFQQAKTAYPENPVILRVYQPPTATTDSTAAERRMHVVLHAATHSWSEGGKEWFLTTLEFLDEIANLLGLSTLENSEYGSKA